MGSGLSQRQQQAPPPQSTRGNTACGCIAMLVVLMVAWEVSRRAGMQLVQKRWRHNGTHLRLLRANYAGDPHRPGHAREHRRGHLQREHGCFACLSRRRRRDGYRRGRLRQPGCAGRVEGYLVPASVPSSDAPTSLDAMQFDLTGESIGTSQSWDGLSGDYYVIAAGQDCTWTLTVTE